MSDDVSQVAIIGMAGRFPGAPDVDTFWDNLVHGREGVTRISADELRASGVDATTAALDNYVPAKGVLADADMFDAAFFGFSPREAEILDPQHRVFLECAWHALESAGYDPARFSGRIGVFGGASLNSYLLFNLMSNQAAVDSAGTYQLLLASDKDFLATRLSYKLDLRGPAVTVQTACSTSLTAVHLACQSLLNGECDIALAGGVSVSVPLSGGYLYEPGGIMSADGHCRAFDAGAAGTVAGNGVGFVVLRRLTDALSSGDTIDAVIRGTAMNNDGFRKVGYTAPSVDGQSDVIAEALAVSDVDATTIGFVEAHGTATPLGDPIEVAALTRAFREYTQEKGFCALGSVKSNVGHLDAAAGVAALIKATLAVKHGQIPPTLHFTEPNPGLSLDTSPFVVNAEARQWPAHLSPRRAAVSSFGIGGTNVHLILEQAPTTSAGDSGDDGSPDAIHVLPVSGRTPKALADNARALSAYVDRRPEVALGDIALSLARRRAFEHRQAVVCRSRAQAIAALDGLGQARPSPTPITPRAGLAFLFPGQGAQYVTMARRLYEKEPVFAAEVDRCARLFSEHMSVDLRDVMFGGSAGDGAGSPELAERLRQTSVTQPALFTIEYALASLLESWGIKPTAMVGHSIGEFVAACLSGVFSLDDAIALVAERGRLVQAMPTGAMLAVFLPEDETRGRLTGNLCVAAVNSTGACVVSGSVADVARLRDDLTAASVSWRDVHTSHAFHSPSMLDAVAPFVARVGRVDLAAPKIPFLSNVTGTWITDEQATSPSYWGEHLLRTVRFADAVGQLLGDASMLLLEVGPGQTLSSLVRTHQAFTPARTVLTTLRHPRDRADDREYLLGNLAALWSAGAEIDWRAIGAGATRSVPRLPGYAFQRQRYWISPDRGGSHGSRTPVASAAAGCFYAPGWRRLPLGDARPGGPRETMGTAATAARWLILGAEVGVAETVATALSERGHQVIRVRGGEHYSGGPGSLLTLDPADRDHFTRLFTWIKQECAGPLRILHAWSLLGGGDGDDADGEGGPSIAHLDHARRHGLDSLIALGGGLIDARWSDPVAIDVLCTGVHAVTGDEPLDPANAMVLGACTVLAQEIADVTCRSLDVTGVSEQTAVSALLRVIGDALTSSTVERELALRGRHWWVRGFDEVALAARPAGATSLRDGGVYLITGGFGGIGLALAEHLARTVRQPVLALLGRSEVPPRAEWTRVLDTTPEHPMAHRIRAMRELERLGARVMPLRADVASHREMVAAVGELRDRFGQINGIVHAAGIASRGLIMNKSTTDIDEVLAAKTVGTLVLDQVCGDDYDFFLLCSSLTALLGGPGQSDYAAANAFLDAFAAHKRRVGDAQVTSIGWATWRSVGMAAGLTARVAGAAMSSHPLLDELVDDNDGSRTWRTTLRTSDSWIVDEHRIQGHGLVPGTTYLELVRAAVADRAEGRAIELTDVLFMLPVIVPDGQRRDIYTMVDLDLDGQGRFSVRSRLGGTGWVEHAVGNVALLERRSEPLRDLGAILQECAVTEVLETEAALKQRLKLDFVERGGQIRFDFGPRWRCLESIQAGERKLLVNLRLDDAYWADCDGYSLHPALLDVAGAAARIHARDVYYLPFTYRGVRVLGALTPTVTCVVTLKESPDSTGETLTCDMELVDPAGRLLVSIVDFTIKRINDLDALVEQIDLFAAAPDSAESIDGPTTGGVLHALTDGMSRAEAVAAFGTLLTAGEVPEHVVVSRRDVSSLRAIAASITPALLASEAVRIAPPTSSHPRPDLATPYLAPDSDEAVAVASIWQEVLGVDRVGVDDDFFALGGHSLAAVQIGAKIRHHFGVQLDLRDFFDGPTVAHTVSVLAAAMSKDSGGAADVIPVLRRELAVEAAGDFGSDLTDLDDLDSLSDDEVDARLRELLADEAGHGELP